MKRSLTAALALIATVCGATVARADLDSLLGNWTAAASHDVDSASGSAVPLAPASQDSAESLFGLSGDGNLASRSTEEGASQFSKSKTLTANQRHDAGVVAGDPLPGLPSPTSIPAIDGYSVKSPTANPYCDQSPVSDDCQRDCEGACGCGKLLSRNQICHLLGESECRPHRSPVLPPPSNLLQMFRSKNSYSAIWAGYADETRARMRNTSPHINGTWNACDDGGLIAPDCHTCGPNCDR